MSIELSSRDPLFLAVKLAQERELLPTAMSSAELQEFTLRLKERLFFSARSTNLWYVDKLKALVERYVQGEGRDNDLAKLRIEARHLLAQAGYVPEAGFPGDAKLGIPPATAGSLRDLSSEKRLNLIFDTQAQTMRGLGMKLRGMSRIEAQPAWELVRYKHAREIQWERDWAKRWTIAADNVEWQGVLRPDNGHLRMIALQTSPIWLALGSSALFADALNVDHPPFAFSSGMGWRAVGFRECEKLGLTKPPAEETETEVRAMIRAFMDRPFFDMEADFKRRGLKVPDALKSTFKPKPIGPDSADTARLARLALLRRKFDENNAQRRGAVVATPAMPSAGGGPVKPRGLAALLTPAPAKTLDEVIARVGVRKTMTGVQAEKVIDALRKPTTRPDVISKMIVRRNANGEEAVVVLAKKLGVPSDEIVSEEFLRSTVDEYLSFLPQALVNQLPAFKLDADATLSNGIAAQYCNASRTLLMSFDHNGDPQTARKNLFHELTHWLHLHAPVDDPWIKRMKAHWDARTSGETEQLLSVKGFDPVQYSGLRDHWFNTYMGRLYGHFEEQYRGGLEVPTKVMELLADPVSFARIWNHSDHAKDDFRAVLSIMFP